MYDREDVDNTHDIDIIVVISWTVVVIGAYVAYVQRFCEGSNKFYMENEMDYIIRYGR